MVQQAVGHPMYKPMDVCGTIQETLGGLYISEHDVLTLILIC